MKNFFKKLRDRFLDPPIACLILIALLAILTLAVATFLLTQKGVNTYQIWGFGLLGISALSVAYTVYGAIRIYPRAKEKLLNWSENRKFFEKLIREAGYRAIIFSIGSFVINIAFAVYNGSIGIVNHSIWFGALAAYYIVLILQRGGILLYHTTRRKALRNGQNETKTYLNDTKVYGGSGILLIVLPVCLSFAILQMVRADDSFVHAGITIYVYALYAFYKMIKAIRNAVVTKKTNEMTVRALQNINLADAMVSILALQTAMFREFGANSDTLDPTVMNAVTGAIVCALTVALGVFMIFNTWHIIKNVKATPPEI